MPKKRNPQNKATANRVLADLTPETYKAIEAYAEASGKSRSGVVRFLLGNLTPAIKKMTHQIYKASEAQSQQTLIQAFTRSAQIEADLMTDER